MDYSDCDTDDYDYLNRDEIISDSDIDYENQSNGIKYEFQKRKKKKKKKKKKFFFQHPWSHKNNHAYKKFNLELMKYVIYSLLFIMLLIIYFFYYKERLKAVADEFHKSKNKNLMHKIKPHFQNSLNHKLEDNKLNNNEDYDVNDETLLREMHLLNEKNHMLFNILSPNIFGTYDDLGENKYEHKYYKNQKVKVKKKKSSSKINNDINFNEIDLAYLKKKYKIQEIKKKIKDISKGIFKFSIKIPSENFIYDQNQSSNSKLTRSKYKIIYKGMIPGFNQVKCVSYNTNCIYKKNFFHLNNLEGSPILYSIKKNILVVAIAIEKFFDKTNTDLLQKSINEFKNKVKQEPPKEQPQKLISKEKKKGKSSKLKSSSTFSKKKNCYVYCTFKWVEIK